MHVYKYVFVYLLFFYVSYSLFITVIYPLAEELIRNKKQAKFNENTEEETGGEGPSSGRKKGSILISENL